MHRTRILVSLLSIVIASLALDSDALAAKPKSKSTSKPSEVIELELRETGGGKASADSRELVVPVDGEIAGWMDLFGESRLCRAKSSPTHDELLRVELECQVDEHSRPVFQLRVERVFGVDQTIMVGEIEVREGHHLSVVATRR